MKLPIKQQDVDDMQLVLGRLLRALNIDLEWFGNQLGITDHQLRVMRAGKTKMKKMHYIAIMVVLNEVASEDVIKDLISVLKRLET